MIDRRRLILAALAGAAAPAVARPAEAAPVALLLPMSGDHAALGSALLNAARLAETSTARSALIVVDSGTMPATAAAAARTAIRRGARAVIGPLFGAQVAPVVAVAGSGVPVLALSNDPVAAAGSFVLGITPGQTVAAVLGYARSRGVRRIAISGGVDAWQVAAARAAGGTAAGLGLSVGPVESADALLVTGDGAALMAAAASASTLQLLGLTTDLPSQTIAVIDGAWLAAPDPDRASDFARRYEAAYGFPPGQLAAIVYDAVTMTRSLAAGGHPTRAGLCASAGFAGVTGPVRFAVDGSAARDLAILLADNGSLRTIAPARAT